MMKKNGFFLLVFSISALLSVAQETRKNTKEGGFVFSEIKEIGATDVKNQYKSGTCWSYSALSFFESEMLRAGVKNPNLSEMFIVRHAYSLKADEYVRRHGKFQFGPGGQFHDVIAVIKEKGMLPEMAYDGQPLAYGKPVHNEMDAMAKAMLQVVIKNPNRELSPYWREAYESMLDIYLGAVPSQIDVDGKKVTPLEYAESTGMNWDDYVEIASFSHRPFYKPFVMSIPDNWMNGSYYNIPIEELLSVMNNALKLGYTIGWDADVSEKGFSFKNGVAIMPDVAWAEMNKKRRDTIFNSPSAELEVTQENRQKMYDNYQTTDDHLMHITGSCVDQNGTPYFIVKNSWGDDRNDSRGYLYASEAYVKAKTIAIIIHKDAIPKGIRKKMGI